VGLDGKGGGGPPSIKLPLVWWVFRNTQRDQKVSGSLKDRKMSGSLKAVTVGKFWCRQADAGLASEGEEVIRRAIRFCLWVTRDWRG